MDIGGLPASSKENARTADVLSQRSSGKATNAVNGSASNSIAGSSAPLLKSVLKTQAQVQSLTATPAASLTGSDMCTNESKLCISGSFSGRL